MAKNSLWFQKERKSYQTSARVPATSARRSYRLICTRSPAAVSGAKNSSGSEFERSVTLAAGWWRKMDSTERMKRGWNVCGGVVQIRKKDELAPMAERDGPSALLANSRAGMLITRTLHDFSMCLVRW